MVIVVDPKVFLCDRRDPNCAYILRKLLQTKEDELRLGMNGALWEEYEKYARRNSLIMVLLKRFRLYKQLRVELEYNFCSKTQAPLLSSKGCDVEIEPTLLGAGLDKAKPLVVYLPEDGIHPSRVFPTCLSDLQTAGLGKGLLSPYEAHKRLVLGDEPRFPENCGELKKLLDDHRIAGKRTERQSLEFKGPKGRLTDKMRKAIAEAVCGMLNGGNGWVLVGVRSDGKIVGFKPEVIDDDGNPKKGFTAGYDDTSRAIREEIDKIQPDPRELFDHWVIQITKKRIVVVISVRKGNRDYKYEGVKVQRKGTETLKIKPIPPE